MNLSTTLRLAASETSPLSDKDVKRVPCPKCKAPAKMGCAPDSMPEWKRPRPGGKAPTRTEGMHYTRWEAAYAERYGIVPQVMAWRGGAVSNRDMFNNYTEASREEREAARAAYRAGLR